MGNTSRRGVALGIAALVATLLFAAAASARPPRGKYYCYYFYHQLTPPTYLGRLYITGGTTYRFVVGGNGRYTYRSGRLNFRSGPLKGDYAVDKGKRRTSAGVRWYLELHNRSGYAGTCDGPA